MRLAFNLESQYSVIMLLREVGTETTGVPPAIKGLVWFTDGSRMKAGTGRGVYMQSVGWMFSFSLCRYATVFHVELFAVLTFVYEFHSQNRCEKYVSICLDCQAALKSLKAVRKTCSFVHQCQKALNASLPGMQGRLFWVPRLSGLPGNEIANELARWCALRFLGPELALRLSRRHI